MDFLYRWVLTAFLVSVYCYSFAQTGYAVKGKVSTENSVSAEGTTVTLLRYPDSTIVKSTICTQTGHFGFENIKPGNYMLFVHKIGYERIYTPEYKIVDGDITINNIVLHIETNQLGEVKITDKRDYIEVKPGKTVLNVDRSILASGNSVFDILSTAPGVRIIDNQVLLKGGQKALVAINGKPIGQLNDEQLADLLKSYLSSMISQVELIENPPAKYDAAGGGGVINIILKKNKEIGFKANVTESAALGQDYKLSTGINFNYRTTRFNLFGGYTFADNKTPRLLDIDRAIGPITLDENYNSTTYLKTHSFNAGADYSIGAKQTVGALIYGYHSQAHFDKGNITNISNNGVLDSDITEKSHIDRGITNINYNLNYRGSFGKGDGTMLSADFDYSTYDRNSEELLRNDFFLASGIAYQQPVFYMDNSPSNINVRSEKLDFSQALSKTGTLGLGIKNNQVNSSNVIDFNGRADTATQFTPVASLTDHFVYKERIDAAYINYSDKFNNTSLTVGLRGEQTKSFSESLNPNKTVNRSYLDFFPNLELTQDISKDNSLTINYNRRILRPNYQDLNPFVAYIDEYSYSTGNTFLKPEYISTFSVSELFKQKYKVALSMVKTSGFFVPVFQQNDSTKIFTTTTSNIGTRYEYSLEFTLPVDITKWWSASFYLYGAYDHLVYNSDSLRMRTSDFTVQVTQDFTIAQGLRLELYGSWESPTYYGIKQYYTQWESRAGISKAILNNNGTIRLAVSDIFNSDEYKYSSHYLNLDLTGREKAGSRFVTATFIYHFGNQSVKGASKRVGGNVDEQNRLKGSGNEN